MESAAAQSTQAKTLVAVTIGLVEGTDRHGDIWSFTPYRPDVILYERTSGPRPTPVVIAVERIAYLGFLKAQGATASPQAPGRKKVRIKAHVPGGKTFLVDADPAGLKNPVGFFATPCEPNSPYRELFFYTHGVNAREDAAPLGELLMGSGALDGSALKKGLDAHQAERAVPLGKVLVDAAGVDPAAIELAADVQARKKLRLGEVLIEAGWISKEQLERALGEQKRRRGKRIGEVLVELNLVTEQVLCQTLATKFLIPLVDLDKYPIDPNAAAAIPRELVERFKVLPVQADDLGVTIAMSDPLAVDAIEAIRFNVRKRVSEVMVIPSQLQRHVAAYLTKLDNAKLEEGLDALLKEMEAEEQRAAEAAPTSNRLQTGQQAQAGEVKESDSAVIRLVNRLIVEAYRMGASDIHIEPNGIERKTVVRFRIDGDCIVYQELPPQLRNPVVARVKIMALLDISERRKPQDGKIRLKTKSGQIELRVATIPTVNDNEDVVLRILASSKTIPLEKMDFSPINMEAINQILAKPYGLMLVVGPTGSGKTTTLHSILAILNKPDTKIWTAEDPVEITQEGLRQVQVQAKIGVTFAAAMRSFLRADPDIIMVGEMRDQETAHTAIEASLTGHLVFSTLHTNTAPETITRLIDMGADPFTFGDALLGVLAQRLTRRICPMCKESYEPSDSEYEELARHYGRDAMSRNLCVASPRDFRLWRGKGCDNCANSGYKGRVGLFELLRVSDDIKYAIGQRAPIEVLRRLAADGGMITLLQDGVEKTIAGLTDLKQVLAVCIR